MERKRARSMLDSYRLLVEVKRRSEPLDLTVITKQEPLYILMARHVQGGCGPAFE